MEALRPIYLDVTILAHHGELVIYREIECVDGVYPPGIVVLWHDVLKLCPSRRFARLQHPTLVVVGQVIQMQVLNTDPEVSRIGVGLDVGIHHIMNAHQQHSASRNGLLHACQMSSLQRAACQYVLRRETLAQVH